MSHIRFLDVLAARKDPAGLSGEVLIDGAHQPPNFKCLSGYVVQVRGGQTGSRTAGANQASTNIHGFQRMNPSDINDDLTFPLAPPRERPWDLC